MRIDKLEAAERQLRAAITMFFERGDPVVIHTLAGAAQGLLRDLAIKKGGEHLSLLHDHPDIPAEHRKRWHEVLNNVRNYLKHADRDHDRVLEWDEKDNEKWLLDAALLMNTVANQPFRPGNVFLGWLTLKEPELRKAMSGNRVGEFCVENDISPDDFRWFLDHLDSRLLIAKAKAKT